jgi:hypothetical protein
MTATPTEATMPVFTILDTILPTVVHKLFSFAKQRDLLRLEQVRLFGSVFGPISSKQTLFYCVYTSLSVKNEDYYVAYSQTAKENHHWK